jgi:hypothetical protein
MTLTKIIWGIVIHSFGVEQLIISEKKFGKIDRFKMHFSGK